MGDISNHKALKSSLKKYPKALRDNIFDLTMNTPVPIFICDRKLRIIAAGNEFLKKLRYSTFDLKDIKLKEISPDSYLLFRKAVTRLSTQQKSEIKKIILLDKYNKQLTGSATLSILKKADSEVIVTYLSRLEPYSEQILQNESVFDDYLYDLTKRGKWLLDFETKLFFGNTLFFQLLGMKPKSFVNYIDVLNLVQYREERDYLKKDLIGVQHNKGIFKHEIRIKGSDEKSESQVSYIRLTFSLYKTSEKEYIAGTIDDISDFKKIERDLIRSRSELEKADRFKSVFLSNLSHEIRTPMNTILGYSELLNQPGLKEEEINNFTSILRAKGNYLLALIDDAIELSRFERNSINFTHTEFNLLPLLQELHGDFNSRRIEAGKTNIELDLIVPENAESQKIYTDYGRLQQLLSNLLSNALKFTEKGRVSFGYKMSVKNFKFFVEDTGIGLSVDDQKKIFNRFEVIEDTTFKRLSGTGLSLTISKHIVEQLGGKIKVQSEENHGSRFQLNIPIIQPSGKTDDKTTGDELAYRYNWKDKIILVAEDEEVNYKFLDAILEKTQAHVLRASNGQEAIDLCSNISQIDIVLMDIKLPVMNGYEAAYEIKINRPDLPIIAQTAYSSQKEIEKCKQAGFDDFISKPIDIQTLFEKIKDQFQK